MQRLSAFMETAAEDQEKRERKTLSNIMIRPAILGRSFDRPGLSRFGSASSRQIRPLHFLKDAPHAQRGWNEASARNTGNNCRKRSGAGDRHLGYLDRRRDRG